MPPCDSCGIGLATVAQRARELSIRRAVGATRADVFALVLGAALGQAALAAALALGIAWALLVFWLPTWMPPTVALDPPALPLSAIGVACATAGATALVGAVIPAWRASSIDMAGVLRD